MVDIKVYQCDPQCRSHWIDEQAHFPLGIFSSDNQDRTWVVLFFLSNICRFYGSCRKYKDKRKNNILTFGYELFFERLVFRMRLRAIVPCAIVLYHTFLLDTQAKLGTSILCDTKLSIYFSALEQLVSV